MLFGLPEVFPRFLPPPPYRNIESRKTTWFLDFLEKFLRCVFTDGLKVVGGLAFISPSTPLQQHGGPKNDTVFQKIFLLYNRSLHPSKNDIQFCFLENFLYYLNNNIEGPENDGELQLFKKSLYSLTATSSGVFSIPDSKRFLISLILLTATSEAEKRQRREVVFFQRNSK